MNISPLPRTTQFIIKSRLVNMHTVGHTFHWVRIMYTNHFHCAPVMT